jgi:hypothetical protein
MARYWQATTFNGFYAEGRNQERQIAQQLFDALGGIRTDEIMGAGVYVWLSNTEDPEIRVKDIGDRTLVEVMFIDRTVIPKKAGKPKVEPVEGEVEAPAAAPEIPPPSGPVQDLMMKVEGVLSGMFSRVPDTPPDMKTRLDLKLARWEKPKPMVIASGGPTGGPLDLGAVERTRGGGGGLGVLVAMIAAVIVLGGAGYYLITTASNDPYYLYQPGTQYEREPSAIGFLDADTGQLIVINVPARQDTAWGSSPRFVRAEDDTSTTTSFIATEVTELRVNKMRMPSVILVPSEQAMESTANLLDIAALEWNQAEGWEDWFETEINRALVIGSLVREDEQLWLQDGDNKVGLELSDLLTDDQRLNIRYALNREKDVVMEIRFQETYAYGQVRTRDSRKLFGAEIRSVTVLYGE